VLNDFVGEVQRSLGYFTNTHRNAQIQYMIGLGNAFRLPGLQKFLQEKLQLEVRKLTQLERTTGESVTAAPTFSENIMSFGVSYGLALQGLKQTRLQTNLLPYEVRFERLIRGKKPWVVAAAASLLIGMCTLAFAKGIEKSAVENDPIKKSMEQLEADKKLVAKNEKAWKDEREKVTKKIESLQKIGAGVQERMNWQLLHQYVNMSTPQPNGDHVRVTSRLLEPVKAKYWTEAAKKAYKELEESRFSTKTLAPDVQRKKDLDIKRNLIQVNIAGINALYTDDLYAFFNKIKTEVPALRGMNPEHARTLNAFLLEKDAKKRVDNFDKPKDDSIPIRKEGGWIVEVRGYTYQKDGEKFIEETIIENLSYPEALKDHNDKSLVSPEMAQQIKEQRIGFLLTYKIQTVDNPVPGQFEVIGKSYLKVLQRGIPAVAEAGAKPGPGGAMPGNPPGPGGPAGAADQKPSRESWKPIGDVASDLFVDNPGGGGGGAAKGEAVVAQPIPRTEFVVVFVWFEPIAGLEPIILDDTKK
jgi:hypothetical protein